MAAPTITGTPVSSSGYFTTGPITVSGYTHPSGDDIFAFVGHGYNGSDLTVPTVTWNGASMTSVFSYTHVSVNLRGTLYRIAGSTNTSGNVVATLDTGADFIGTVGVFSANGVASVGTPVTNSFDFSGTAGLTTTVTDGSTNSLILGMGIARRSAAQQTLAAFTVASNGTDLVNAGAALTNPLSDRTCIFTKAGSASVGLTLTYAYDSDRAVLMGLALNGASASSAAFGGINVGLIY